MVEKNYTVKQWIDLFKKLPNSVKLEEGARREDILQYLKAHQYQVPEEYVEFMELANGADLFHGKVNIWKIPVDAKEEIPKWKSMEFMNLESTKSAYPDVDGVFLFAGNYLGDYIGFCMKDTEFDVIYISPETQESWNYYTFCDWLGETWEEMGD